MKKLENAIWSDYTPQTTEYYVRKHFREETCETKVKTKERNVD